LRPGDKEYGMIRTYYDEMYDGAGQVRPHYREFARWLAETPAELLAQRGLMPVPGGYTWRTDSRLTLASPMRLTDEQAMAFVRRVGCPTQLVVAADGMLARHPELLSQLPFTVTTLPGGHHLHLNDEAGAVLVADCFNRFFSAP